MDNQRYLQFDSIRKRRYQQVENTGINEQLHLLQEQLNQLPQLSVLSAPAVIQYKLTKNFTAGSLVLRKSSFCRGREVYFFIL